jgi:glycosyltransferase involved in cell wall biosynthesis
MKGQPGSPKELRVMHVVTSLEPGGMENGVCNIARGLAPLGIVTHVACLERRGAFADRLPSPENVRVLGKSGGFSIGAVWRLWRALKAVRPHVVHTHNLGPLIYAALATLGGRTRPIVHGEHSQLAPWELEARRIRQRRQLYRRCRAVHTVSEGQLAELARCGFAHANLSAIPNGVDTGHFSPGDKAGARMKMGLPPDALVLGLVGRFGPYKRHDVLLAAFEEIAPSFPSAHLLFVGSGGSEEARIQGLAGAHPARERIHLTGFQADPAPCYQAMDLLVIPSVNEGMSNAALEAMSSGLPVLANTGCGSEQIVTNDADGVISDLSSAPLLAAGIASLLGAPERLVDMGRTARITVTRRFSLSTMLDAYDQLYRAHAR